MELNTVSVTQTRSITTTKVQRTRRKFISVAQLAETKKNHLNRLIRGQIFMHWDSLLIPSQGDAFVKLCAATLAVELTKIYTVSSQFCFFDDFCSRPFIRRY